MVGFLNIQAIVPVDRLWPGPVRMLPSREADVGAPVDPDPKPLFA
jgi:hypothetical protein